MHQLYAHTCDEHCTHITLADIPAGNLDDLWSYVQAALRDIHNGDLVAGQVDEDTWLETYRILWQGVADGYGVSIDPEQWPATDAELLAELRTNTRVLSAFKNHQWTKEVAELLTDGDRIRTWSEFRELANQISKVYHQAWLQTEYNTAIATGQMSSKWNDLTGNPDFPNLRYDTAGDERVRDEHAAIDGIVRPADDPFWDTYYPPNGWNCRCDVAAVDNEPTPGDTPTPEIPKSFQNNPGKTGKLYSDEHPYYDTPDADAIRDESSQE